MNAARILLLILRHVLRIITDSRAIRTRRRKWPVVGVHQPARCRIGDHDGLIDRVQSLPLGVRRTAIDRERVVVLPIALRNEVAIHEGDRAVRVGVHRVVRRVGTQLHHLLVAREVVRLRATERLHQRLDRLLHESYGHPLAVVIADDRPLMAEVRRDRLALHSRGCLVRKVDALGLHFALATGVLVERLAVTLRDRELILVGHITATGGVHPAVPVVETLIDEELPPRDRPVGLEPCLAGNVDFGPKVVVGVRIDQQQRMTVGGILGCNREAVRPRRLPQLDIRIEPGLEVLA